MTFNFILHTYKNKNGERPIYLKISNDYKQVSVKTKIVLLTQFWNNKTKSVKNTKAFPQGIEINTQLANFKQKAQNVYNRYYSEHLKQPELKELKELIENEIFGNSKSNNSNLISFFENYLLRVDSVIKRDGSLLSEKRKSELRLNFKVLKEFISIKQSYNQFENIDTLFYNDYINFLEDKELSLNTIGKYIKNLKNILNIATIEGVNTKLTFTTFVKPNEDTVHIYLNEEELQEMENLDLELGSSLDKTRTLFLFGAWTGLRFGDCKTFNENAEILKEEIHLKTQKTKKSLVLPILPVTKRILKENNNKLPVFSNAVYNRNLKELGKLLPSLQENIQLDYTTGGKKIKETHKKYDLLVAHASRRSFATNMVHKGIPVITIMAITGHSKEQTFYKYVKLSSNFHANKMNEEFKKKLNFLHIKSTINPYDYSVEVIVRVFSIFLHFFLAY